MGTTDNKSAETSESVMDLNGGSVLCENIFSKTYLWHTYLLFGLNNIFKEKSQ